MPINKITPISNSLADDFEIKMNRLAMVIGNLIRSGKSVDKAVEMAFKDIDYTGEVTKYVEDSIIAGISAGATSKAVVKKSKSVDLSQHWTAGDVKLKTVIRQNGIDAVNIVKTEIKNQLKANNAWNTAARNIKKTDLIKGDISGKIKQLEIIAKRNLSPSDAQKYTAQIRQAQRHVDRLATPEASTNRLKKAYQKVIDVTQANNTKAIDAAINRAVKAKVAYNAERIAKTEISRAYGNATFDSFNKNPDVIGVKSVLSSRHVITDICDFHAEADLYGMGPGIYPLESSPEYPYHVSCQCILQPVYEGEAEVNTKMDTKSGEKYLESLSESDRKSMLGANGDPSNWKTDLRNNKPHTDKTKIKPVQ